MAEAPLQQAYRQFDAGRFEQACAGALRVLQRSPGDPGANSLMSASLAMQGKLVQAEFYAKRAAEAAPEVAEAAFAWADLLFRLGRYDDAAGAVERVLARSPEHPDALAKLASAHAGAKRLGRALGIAERGLKAHPASEVLAIEAGRLALLLGDTARAVEIAGAGCAANPGSLRLARFRAFAANYEPTVEPADAFDLHRAAGALLESRLPEQPPGAWDLDAERPLRIGLLSADLNNHVVARFLGPLLRNLDGGSFSVRMYMTSSRTDGMSQRLASMGAGFVVLAGVGTAEQAAAIRGDRIDILIELGGYTGEPALDPMAQRCAPLQGTYLGYPATTGCTRVDFRLVDSLTDPPGEAERFATERLMRLDPCFLCYEPQEGDAGAARAGRAEGGIRFGSFNALQKINPPLLRLWSRVLEAMPGSTLVIKNMALVQAEVREVLRGRLAAAGLGVDRVRIVAPHDRAADHLAAYAEIDIALDTFPYCGTTTTCEALWMGVPVVSKVGGVHASRVGLSLLSAVGLSDLAAGSDDEFVQTAAGLAGDRDRLAALRGGLRETMRGSVLCDGAGFAARFGAVMRGLWRERCAAGLGSG
ncbi:MAG: tetratricopeptide repeat protein [Phycisphaeraceae bacterium]|nr:tetratricopeptide repeat protein [Phycisphaeraceae bacterium]